MDHAVYSQHHTYMICLINLMNAQDVIVNFPLTYVTFRTLMMPQTINQNLDISKMTAK